MKYFFIYLMAVLLLFALPVDMNSVVVLKHCSNVFNKKYVDKLTTPRKPINRTTSLTSTDIYFKPGVELGAPLYIHIASYKKFATQYKLTLIDYKVEMCEALKVKTHPLYIFFFSKANKTDSNYMDPCPVKGHVFIKPYYTSYENVPRLLPSGEWRLDITMLNEDNESIFTLFNYYEITTHGIAEF